MKDFKIKVKDVKEFIGKETVLYASGDGKQFHITLHAGPNMERYIVKNKGVSVGFTKLGDAVRLFNTL